MAQQGSFWLAGGCLLVVRLIVVASVQCANINIVTEPTVHLRAQPGESVRISCLDAPLHSQQPFNWYRANRTLLLPGLTLTDRRFRIDPSTGHLYIDAVRAADADFYKCVVPRAADVIEEGATVLVVDGEGERMGEEVEKVSEEAQEEQRNYGDFAAQPLRMVAVRGNSEANIVTEPTVHLRAQPGESVRISCLDAPLPSQQPFNWYRANRTLLMPGLTLTDRRYRIDPRTGHLYIDAVRAADADYYKCVVPRAVDVIEVGATVLVVDGERVWEEVEAEMEAEAGRRNYEDFAAQPLRMDTDSANHEDLTTLAYDPPADEFSPTAPNPAAPTTLDDLQPTGIRIQSSTSRSPPGRTDTADTDSTWTLPIRWTVTAAARRLQRPAADAFYYRVLWLPAAIDARGSGWQQQTVTDMRQDSVRVRVSGQGPYVVRVYVHTTTEAAAAVAADGRPRRADRRRGQPKPEATGYAEAEIRNSK